MPHDTSRPPIGIPQDEASLQHVERVRRAVGLLDRYRSWIVLVTLLLLAGLVWSFVRLQAMFANMVGKQAVAWEVLGFVAGLMGGVGFGCAAVPLLWVLWLCFNGCRTERLLLQYHDALQQLQAPRQPDVRT